MYDRACRELTPEKIAELEATGAPRAIRFLTPDGQTIFDDLVRGTIAFDNANIEDFVILRSDRQPTYHLSVVADDIAMAISHVVRGDDHISNTPKHVLLYQAFGQPLPKFAHVPLILGPDRKRLSKRHGATSVTEYQRLGYLPEAMVNFLALLGWSPGDDREFFTRDELIRAFTLEGISGGNAVFNPDKLDWMNQQHIMRMPPDALASALEPILRAEGLWRDEYATERRAWFVKLVELFQPRLKRLVQFPDDARPFLAGDIMVDEAAADKHLKPEVRESLAALRAAFAAASSFDKDTLEAELRVTAARAAIKPGALIHATRVAVTGRAVSPGLFEVLELLGQAQVLVRLDTALSSLSTK
jgi:glutamyl-tRNA synthetase